jgi:amino acid permease
MMVLLLLGIVISYVCAAVSFLRDAAAPFRTGSLAAAAAAAGAPSAWPSSSWIPAASVAFAMWTMSLVPNVGYLSKMSAVGLLVLLLTFGVIAGYGAAASLRRHSHRQAEPSALVGATSSAVERAAESGPFAAALPLLPASVEGVCRWYGIVVYSMGTVPLTYNFRESMRNPGQIMGATRTALASVAFSYLALGIGTLLLFPDLDGDVLHELPGVPSAAAAAAAAFQGGTATGMPSADPSAIPWRRHELLVPLLARLAMVSVVVMTAPLLIVPCGELVEGKIFHRRKVGRRLDSRGEEPSHPHQHRHQHQHRHLLWIGMTRGILCGVSAAVATAFPSFVQVLAVVGSACVGAVSFVVPPLFHYRLRALAARRRRRQQNHGRDGGDKDGTAGAAAGDGDAAVDLAMLAAGTIATVLATLFSTRRGGGG